MTMGMRQKHWASVLLSTRLAAMPDGLITEKELLDESTCRRNMQEAPKEKPQGIFPCEKGNLNDPITPEGGKTMEVLEIAFNERGALKLGPPQFCWKNGETMVAFKADANAYVMQPITKITRVDNWQTMERFMVIGATKHGEHTLLIYNHHQPSSDQRQFRATQKMNFCKAILENTSPIGFGFDRPLQILTMTVTVTITIRITITITILINILFAIAITFRITITITIVITF